MVIQVNAQINPKNAIYTDKNILKTQVKKVTIGPGPEDFDFDSTSTSNVRLILSIGDYRNRAPQTKGYWFVNLDDSNLTPIKFKMEGYDLSKIGTHGIKIWYDKITDETFLFAVSHEDGRKTHKILQFKIASQKLIFVKEFLKDPTAAFKFKPNDLTVDGKGLIYYSNPGNLMGSLFLKQKRGIVARINASGNHEVLADNRGYPNGVVVVKDTLYFCTSTENKLFKIDLNNKAIEKVTKLKGGDNMHLLNGSIYIAQQPKIYRMIWHAMFGAKAPSAIFKYEIKSGLGKALFYTNGKLISGSSTGIAYNGSLYLSQIFKDYLLIIRLQK
jgi:uncharacterized pyridoxamine 5'-phosphate oxidase family protein